METGQLNQVVLHEDNLLGADLKAWLAGNGGQGLTNAARNPDGIISVLEEANLRGMGGAGFPTHRKWQAVAERYSADKWLICNGN